MRRETNLPSPEILPEPVLCVVDVVLLTLAEGRLAYGLIRRDQAPFRGIEGLPGGFVHPSEDRDLRSTAERVLREKAGLDRIYLEQLGAFSGPTRDPRGWSVSIVWFALVPATSLLAAMDHGLVLRDAADLRALPFDHGELVRATLERVRSKSSYSSLPVHLCPREFTLPQLQSAYEAVLGEPINKVSFRRKMVELDFLEEVPGELSRAGGHRPAQLWRLREGFRDRLSLTDRGINSGG